MNPRMVNVDRQTPMLLPPDLREWVPADDMVHFAIETMESMKLSTLVWNRRGSGSEQYPPSNFRVQRNPGLHGSRRLHRT